MQHNKETKPMRHNASNDGRVHGRWRRRFHDAGVMIIAASLTAIALNWAWPRLHKLAPNLSEQIRFVDAFALAIALGMLVFTVRAAWQAAHAWHSHDPSERN